MAFPSVESENPTARNDTGGAATSGDVAATSHAVVLPATVSAGALLMMFGRIAVGTAAPTATGWTFVSDNSDASDDRTFFGWKDTLAAGTEDGTSVTVSHTSAKMVAFTASITGAADPASRAPESSTVAVGTGLTANATTCTPTGGAKDYLWFLFIGGDGEQAGPLDITPPSGYGSGINSATGAGGAVATNCHAGHCRRTLNAASEDPGTWDFTVGVNAGWAAWTIAIHPAGAAAVLPPRPTVLQQAVNRSYTY